MMMTRLVSLLRLQKLQRPANSLQSIVHAPSILKSAQVDLRLHQSCRTLTRSSVSLRSSGNHQKLDGGKRLVIFDKDGTLVCVHAYWAPWIKTFVKRIEDASSLELANTIYDKLSFDNTNSKLKRGVLGEGTHAQVRDALTQILIEEGVPWERAYTIVHDCYQSLDLSVYGDIQPIGDVVHLLNAIKSKGYLIAVNTSDGRDSIEKTLDHLDLRHLIDMVVCGDDENILPKPHPSTALKICNKLQVQPCDVIMVGDSASDMMLVSNAGLGCGIGVLTGIAPREVLERHGASHVVDDVHEALPIILEYYLTKDTLPA